MTKPGEFPYKEIKRIEKQIFTIFNECHTVQDILTLQNLIDTIRNYDPKKADKYTQWLTDTTHNMRNSGLITWPLE